MSEAPRLDPEVLSAYLDGELPESEAAEVRRRLDQDPDARQQLEGLERTVAALRELAVEPAPEELRARIAGVADAVRPPRGRVVGLPRFATLAAAVLVGVVTLVLVLPNQQDRGRLTAEHRETPLESRSDAVPEKRLEEDRSLNHRTSSFEKKEADFVDPTLESEKDGESRSASLSELKREPAEPDDVVPPVANKNELVVKDITERKKSKPRDTLKRGDVDKEVVDAELPERPNKDELALRDNRGKFDETKVMAFLSATLNRAGKDPQAFRLEPAVRTLYLDGVAQLKPQHLRVHISTAKTPAWRAYTLFEQQEHQAVELVAGDRAQAKVLSEAFARAYGLSSMPSGPTTPDTGLGGGSGGGGGRAVPGGGGEGVEHSAKKRPPRADRPGEEGGEGGGGAEPEGLGDGGGGDGGATGGSDPDAGCGAEEAADDGGVDEETETTGEDTLDEEEPRAEEGPEEKSPKADPVDADGDGSREASDRKNTERSKLVKPSSRKRETPTAKKRGAGKGKEAGRFGRGLRSFVVPLEVTPAQLESLRRWTTILKAPPVDELRKAAEVGKKSLPERDKRTADESPEKSDPDTKVTDALRGGGEAKGKRRVEPKRRKGTTRKLSKTKSETKRIKIWVRIYYPWSPLPTGAKSGKD